MYDIIKHKEGELMITKLFLVFACSISLLSLSGCAPSKPKLCTTAYPIEYLVSRIGGEYVETCNISENKIIQRTTIKENYKELLANADVLLFIGGLEPYMEMYLEDLQSSKVEMLDLGAKSGIYDFRRYTTSVVEGKLVTIESDYYEGDLFASADMYKSDPMLWLDPIAMTSMASTIRDYLVQKFPEYAKVFHTNFDNLETELARLDADFQDLKEEQLNISFVSISPSFGNWQKSYGIRVYPVSLSKYGALPTEGQLAEIKKRIQMDGVRYIVKESNLPEDMLALHDQLASELGLISVEMHNISSLQESDIEANNNYLTLMYQNLKLLESMAN